MLGPQSFLTLDEVHTVLADLRPKAAESLNAKVNLAIFRLSCCCGLRTCEILGLDVSDFLLETKWPTCNVRPEITKGKNGKARGRLVPLWWDAETLIDLIDYMHWRKKLTKITKEGKGHPFIIGVRPDNVGKRMLRSQVSKKWKTALKVLGSDRVRQLSIHRGRDTFASFAIRAGRNLREVQLALGHASIRSTDQYLHAIPSDDAKDLFGK